MFTTIIFPFCRQNNNLIRVQVQGVVNGDMPSCQLALRVWSGHSVGESRLPFPIMVFISFELMPEMDGKFALFSFVSFLPLSDLNTIYKQICVNWCLSESAHMFITMYIQ